jgi:hypothetical protein
MSETAATPRHEDVALLFGKAEQMLQRFETLESRDRVPHPDHLTEAITAAVIAAMAARPRDETHAEHHEWVKAKIAKEKARATFWEALAAKSLPGIVWALIAAAATGLWKLLTTHITWH